MTTVARATVAITAVTPRATQYILDYDEEHRWEYHLLKGTVTVGFAGPMSEMWTRVGLTLLDENDEAVPLVAGTEVTLSYRQATLGQGQTAQYSFDFALNPDQRLDPERRYRVRAQLYQRVLIGQTFQWMIMPGITLDSTSRRYYHFTNTADSDPQHNVIAVVESVTITRDWRIDTLGNDNRNFSGSAVIRLVRYDDPGLQPARDDLLDFELRLKLWNNLESQVALAYPSNSAKAFSQQMTTWTEGNLPFEMTKTVSFSFRPATQLDSVSNLHQVGAEVWAEPAPGQAKLRMSGGSSPFVRLLDYNGTLRCGTTNAADAVLTAAARTATAPTLWPFINPTSVQAELNVTGLTLSASGATFTGNPGIISTRLGSNGVATYYSSTPLVLSNPAGGTQLITYLDVVFQIGTQVSLSSAGATASTIGIATLPAGMGISYGSEPPSAGGMLDGFLPSQNNVPLNGSLAPSSSMNWMFSQGRWVMEETKPVLIRVTAITWEPSTGQFHLVASGEVHHPETVMRQVLEAAPPEVPNLEKPSNNDYWLQVQGVNTMQSCYIKGSPPGINSNNAALAATFNVGQGEFTSHHPEALIQTGAAGGQIVLQNDLMVSTNSYLDQAKVTLSYLAGDPEADASECGGAATTGRTVQLPPGTATTRLNFTPTGGLRASVTAANHALKWGYIGSGQYAFATDAFQSTVFYMPGTFYRQTAMQTGDPDLGHQYTPIALHTCGHVDGFWRFVDMEPSGSLNYRNNTLRADYAGINARVQNEAAGFKGWSIIAGQNAGSYPLTAESRYYARKSGVTGIHDASGGPTAAVLYGFPATFSSYGFSFRDCRVTNSVTNGGLAVPYPSDFALELENIRFSSTGRPLDAKLPSSLGQLTLKYWNCKMTPTALAFSSTDPCDESAGLLRVQAGIEMPNLGQTLHGELGFRANGQIATDAASGLTSRLKAPSHISFRGPQKTDTPTFESYTLTPVTDVYLNNYADYPSTTTPKGFLNVAGKLDVAFFSDLEVHVQTTAGTPGQEGSAPLYMMGGRTWVKDGKNYFTDPTGFDSTNRGFPQGVTLDAYRTGANYRPTATRSWMDVVDFNYPLAWDNGSRSFRSPDDYDDTVDLLVIEAQHRLEYLSAEQANLRFGVTYAGTPELDLGNMLVNAVDEATGGLAALEEALGDAVGGVLLAGSDAMAGLLNDSMDDLFGPVLEDALGPFVDDQVLDPLALPDGSLRPQSEWPAALQNSLTNPTSWLQDKLVKLGSDGANQPAYVAEISDKIDEAIEALDVFIDPADGLLAVDANGNYKFAADLVFALIDMVADEELKTLLGIQRGGSAEAALNAQVTGYVNQYAPSLNTIKGRLEQLKAQLNQVKTRLNVGQELANVIKQQFTSGSAELQTLADILSQDIIAHLEANYSGNPDSFALASNRDATSDFIVRRLRDRMAAGAIAMRIQTLLREQLQDLQGAVDQTVGSMFSNFNRIIRALVADAAGAVNEATEGLLGELGTTVKAGSLDGSAVIRGDRLERLRLDLKLELELDEPMTFQGFLEINQMEADDAREIKVGAIDVPIEMFDATADFTIIGRIIFEGNTPTNLGGSIEMTRGQLEFESFKITTLGASLMFGADENFLAAKLAMEFESFRVAGGIFVGHSNTLEPLAMIDPMVAGVIPSGSITGVYVYGEVFMPIVDLTCLFRVSAGLGIGAFYFTEGPTYGGKIFAAVEGEALCVVTVRGEVTLIGVKSDIMRFKGAGKVSGKVGWCPFCIKFKKSVGFTYDENNGFDADY